MKILHITDLHFKTGKANDDQAHVCRAISEGLTKESAPDLVLFTGDLVHNGNKRETFDTAWKILTTSLIEKWGISADRFFICPGNHDVDRGKELPMVAKGVDEISNLERLDEFTTSQNDKAEFDVSLKNLENYLTFQADLKTTHFLTEDLITPLFTSHRRIINDKKVGIVSLNSAWRCKSSKIDRGNLMFPPSHLHSAFEHIQDCEVRLLLMHHPISDFKEFISRELEKIIYRDFHVLFTGHIHGKRLDAHLLSEEGIAIVVGPAALVHYETWSNVGCGFYHIDTDLWKLNASVCEYDKNTGILNPPRYYGAIEIPFNSIKAEKIDLLEKLRQIYETEVEKANDLILPQPGEIVKTKFLDVFTDPVIYDVPTSVINEKSKPLEFAEIRDEHATKIIYGEDKSGKTLLLEKLFLDYLFMFTSQQILPLFIDAKIYESGPSEASIEQLLARKYSVNRNKIKELIKQYKVCLLIDNYEAGYPKLNKSLSDFLAFPSQAFCILTASEYVSNAVSSSVITNDQTLELYIHEIGGSQIRKLVQNYQIKDNFRIDHLMERSKSLFAQLNIPVSYWTFSLFFSVADNETNLNLRSQFDLVQLYVEKMLERNRFSTGHLKTNFETFKSYLANLAYFLHANNPDSLSASWAEIVEFTDSYRKQNLKFAISTKGFMDLLEQLNLFKRTEDEKLTFRVNGIFEYSLALWSYQNEEFRNKLFEESFLLHPNLWEYYSGLAKNDVNFLKKVVTRVSGIFDPLVKQYIDDIPEDSLLLKVPSSMREELSLVLHGEMETDSINPLASDELDRINEKYTNQLPAEIKNSKNYHASNLVMNETDLNAIERAFRIVSRVFRNTDLNHEDEVVLIFDKILVWGMLFGAAMEDELKDTPSDEVPFPGEEDDKEFWKEFVRQYMPLVIQGMIFHHLAQANMERIFELVRDKYASDVQKKQYKYFISALLVIELNPAEHVAQIKTLINSTTNSTLRHVLYYKLITYHLVKGHENKNFATNIRPLIMLLAERLWPNGRAMAEAQLRQQEKIAQIKPD